MAGRGGPRSKAFHVAGALILVVALVGTGIALGVLLGSDDPSTTRGRPSRPGGEEVADTPPLSGFEEALVGGWSRYHSYDGSREYLIFDADRSACAWEKNASGSVIEEDSYAHWELLAGPADTTIFSIHWGDPGDLWTIHVFRYAEDEVLIGGQSNLDMSRDPDLIECFS